MPKRVAGHGLLMVRQSYTGPYVQQFKITARSHGECAILCLWYVNDKICTRVLIENGVDVNHPKQITCELLFL